MTGLQLLAQAMPTERAEQHIELSRWSSGNPLLVGGLLTAAGLYAVYWLYRKEARGQVTPRLRWTLVACRILVLLLLGLIGLEPVLVNFIHRRLEGCTIVLADTSASMSLADPYRAPEDAQHIEKFLGAAPKPDARPTRSELTSRLLNQENEKFLHDLANKNPVKLFTFSDAASLTAQISPSTTQPADAKSSQRIDINAAGPATNVAQAIRTAIDAATTSPIAGVVLLTDGQFNQGESSEAIAALLKQKGIPLYAIGVGDPSEPINAAVTEISAPRAAFKNDPFTITVRVSAQGVGNEPIKVELLAKSSGASTAQLIDSKTVQPAADGQIEPISFQQRSPKPGSVTYTARIPNLKYESVITDNQRDTVPAVQVLDDKMRVLLVSGAPTYDYRYLARLLERDKSVDLSCWLQSADVKAVRDGTTIITELPTSPEEILKYDAIILLDVDPAQLDSNWAGTVASFITDHGGGLFYEAGNKYTSKFIRSPNTGPLVELLPIVPDPDADIIVNEEGYSQSRSWPIALTDAAAGDPILRMADSAAENRATWSVLEGPYWHYPVRREKPIAQVLMRHSDPRMAGSYGSHVLFATQFVGSGRTAYLGFNSTWRWRKGEEKYFTRFWTQALRFLVEGKLLGGQGRAQIQTAKDQFEIGESVVVTVRALDDKFAPLAVPQLDLTVSPSNDSADDSTTKNRAVPLTPMPGREGYYQGRFNADRPGTLRLSLKLPGAAPDQITKREISVVQPDVEMRITPLNRTALQQFAAATGGKYLDIDEATKLPELIPDKSRSYVVRERPRPLWDNKYVLIVLVAILSLEWILRKKAKLL